MEQQRPDPAPVYVTAKISGVVLPTWLAVALGSAAVLASASLLLVIFLFWRFGADASAGLSALSKEIRILQVHVQDVENVLIRQGLAKRDDFAEWPVDSPRHARREEH